MQIELLFWMLALGNKAKLGLGHNVREPTGFFTNKVEAPACRRQGKKIALVHEHRVGHVRNSCRGMANEAHRAFVGKLHLLCFRVFCL